MKLLFLHNYIQICSSNQLSIGLQKLRVDVQFEEKNKKNPKILKNVKKFLSHLKILNEKSFFPSQGICVRSHTDTRPQEFYLN